MLLYLNIVELVLDNKNHKDIVNMQISTKYVQYDQYLILLEIKNLLKMINLKNNMQPLNLD